MNKEELYIKLDEHIVWDMGTDTMEEGYWASTFPFRYERIRSIAYLGMAIHQNGCILNKKILTDFKLTKEDVEELLFWYKCAIKRIIEDKKLKENKNIVQHWYINNFSKIENFIEEIRNFANEVL